MTIRSDAHDFSLLTEFLKEHEALWRERPFVQENLSWEETCPELAQVLLNLSDAELDRIEEKPALLKDYGPTFLSLCTDIQRLSHVTPALSQDDSSAVRIPTGRQLPARKAVQIAHFCHASRQILGSLGGDWAEWCSGKGHLGRALLQHGCNSVQSLEKNTSLVKKGRELAHGIQQEFHTVDVMNDSLDSELRGLQGIASLHACGTLTDKVLDTAITHGMTTVIASPCCYHAGVGRKLRLRSSQGQKVCLAISGEQLRLVTAEVVVARSSLRINRIKQMGWRLSLDKWVRECTGGEEYTRQGSFSARQTGGSFEDFMKIACERMKVPLPAQHFTELEALGHQRAGVVRRLALVRGLFRRTIEKWINVDRVLHLQEMGVDASLHTFCSREYSPRNHLIVGRVPSA